MAPARFLALAGLLCLLESLRAGLVTTLDGRTFAGHLHVRDPQHLEVSTNGDCVISVELTNLLSAQFDAPASTNAAPVGLSREWRGVDIGSAVRLSGEHIEGHTIRVTDGGTVMGRASRDRKETSEDSCRFVYQALAGSGQIVARVRSPLGEILGQAGLMFRQDTDRSAAFAAITRTERHYSLLMARELEGRPLTRGDLSKQGLLGPAWLKLVREGHTCSGYESADGSNWVRVGELPVLMTESQPVLVGVFSSGGWGMDDNSPIIFEQVQVTAGPPAAGMGEYWPKGVVTRDGSALAMELIRVGNDRLVCSRAGAQLETPLSDLAWLLFKQLSPPQQDLLRKAKPGVLLFNGDYVEGAFQALDQEHVGLSSILFGIRQYKRQSQVSAVVLRSPEPAPGGWRIALHDGSVLCGQRLDSLRDPLPLNVPLLGATRIPLAEVARVARTPETPSR